CLQVMRVSTCSWSSFFFLILRPPPTSTLFPYTTLFRSHERGGEAGRRTVEEAHDVSGFARAAVVGGEPQPPAHRIELLARWAGGDRKSTRLNSSHVAISYAVFCLKKKK